jgi:Ca-activated chloride channel family protein
MMEQLAQFLGKNSKKNEWHELDPDKTRVDGTALFDSIYAASTRQPAGTGAERKAVIVFSDGQDNSSAHDLIDAIEAAQNSDSLIYTVRYSKTEFKSRDRYGALEMTRLAHETGGAAFDASKDDVPQSLKQVADELRSMYDVGYATTNHTADGRFRNVEIRIKKPGLTVRAKPGYYAR